MNPKVATFILLIILILIGNEIFKKLPKPVETPTPKLNVQEIKYVSPISIDYLRSLNLTGSQLAIEEELSRGSNYKRYIASYKSEGYKIYGLLTVPESSAPVGGFPAIVFNHGYIPPSQYFTTEKYVAYVDYLAKSGFVVFKIDFRGHGDSEGSASGSYFSNAYTIDAINAVKSLQKYSVVNPEKIGMWGHSMSGNATLRAMEVSPDIKAGVIWAGAVYSYADFQKYGISDSSYSHSPDRTKQSSDSNRETSSEIQNIRNRNAYINFDTPFWQSISLTYNLERTRSPIQLHHARNDEVVSLMYSRDLAEYMRKVHPNFEYYEYDGGGHNIESPYFETAMQRTVDFFKKNL